MNILFEREEAKTIVEHIDLVRHFADGGGIEWKAKNYKGEDEQWEEVDRIFVSGLPRMRKKNLKY